MAGELRLSAGQAVAFYRRLRERASAGLGSPVSLARADNRRWQSPPHIETLDRLLVDVAERRIRRLIVELPPRHGKSSMVSHYFPAWYLLKHPEQRIILASYESDFAASWGRRTRDTVSEFGPRFGVSVRDDSSAAGRWDTAAGGGMVAVGVGAALTGRGANILILDDVVKNQEEADSPTQREKAWSWYQSVAYTRLEPDGAIIIAATRWHHDDLLGRLLREQERGGEQWELLCLPAIAETDDPLGRAEGEALWAERFPLPALEEIRRAVGVHWWASLYQQRPTPREGGLFRWEWIDSNRVMEVPPLSRVVVAVDPALSANAASDMTGIVAVGQARDDQLYVLASLGLHLSPEGWASKALDLLDSWHAERLVIEKNAGGDLIESVIRGVRPTAPLSMVTARTGKAIRAERVALAYETGQAHHLGRLDGLEEELVSFPRGAHDDQLDALVHGATFLLERERVPQWWLMPPRRPPEAELMERELERLLSPW